jgi:hypothetical protein
MKTLTTVALLTLLALAPGCASTLLCRCNAPARPERPLVRTSKPAPLGREGLRAELSTTVKPLPAVGSPLP